MPVTLATGPAATSAVLSSGYSSSATLAYTGPSTSGADCLGLVHLVVNGATYGPTSSTQTRSATWGGTSMTSLGALYNPNTTYAWSEVFYLKNPPAGYQSIVVNVTGTKGTYVYGNVNALAYKGVDPTYTPTLVDSSDGNQPFVVTSKTGNRVCAFFSTGGTGQVFSWSPTASVWASSYGAGTPWFDVLDNAGSASVSHSFTGGSGSAYYHFAALDIQAPPSGTGILTMF